MLDPLQIVQTTAQPAAVIHLTIPRSEIQMAMGPAINEVMQALMAQGLRPAGPVFSHHFKMNPETFDFEVGVVISGPITATGRVKPGHLPAARVARTIYRGPYQGLGQAWGEFNTMLAAQNLKPAAGLWECYTVGPESGNDPSKWSTELNRPLLD